MRNNRKLFFFKNIALLLFAVICPVVCKLFSRSLPLAAAADGSGSVYIRNITGYVRDNYLSLIFFFVFVTSGLTSLLLGYLLHRRFDRNRHASLISVKTGLLFLTAAVYFLTASRSLFVFPNSREMAGYLAAAGMLFMPVLCVDYIRLVCEHRWLNIADWVFTALAAAFFIFGMAGVPQSVFSVIVTADGVLFCLLVIVVAVLHLRSHLSKSAEDRPVVVTLCSLQIVLLIAAQLFYFTDFYKLYILCLGLAMSIMAFLVFSDTLDIAARRYIKSSDYENVRKMAYVDSLCNISNRNAFMLEQEASFDCDSLCYVVFDLNNLKGVNDHYGHAEGDRLIQKAAELIEQTFGDFGKCFRIGGDEFAVIGRNQSIAQIKKLIHELNKRINAYNRHSAIKLNLAYGYAMRQNTDINTYELFNKADKQMYRFKRRSKAAAKPA
ncbi:MAG: GGDEF domain-containing protein [Ruminococcus sp.]|nr:GGDEF domain-containing protein [Ruminococcus sp.]